ncbi:DUF2207 domain-containing protein, partial [Patescibacteria group bacterium]
MRKIIFLLLVILLIPNVFGAEKINSQFTHIIIQKDGTIDVTERIKYTFPDYRHGIIRKIPYIKINSEGKKFKLDIDVDSVSHQYTKYNENKELVIKIGNPDKTITGTHDYEIKYTVSGTITYFSEHDELYWNAPGHGGDVPIDSAVTVVELFDNSDVNFESINFACYTGTSGSTISNCSVVKNTNTRLSYASQEVLGPREGMTVVYGFPKGVVDVLEPTPDRSHIWQTIIMVFWVSVAGWWFFLLPIKIFLRWLSDKKNTDNKKRVVAAWFEPPKDLANKPFTPAETFVIWSKMYKP